MKKLTLIMLCSAALIGITACDQQAQSSKANSETNETTAAGFPVDLFVATAPEGARSVGDIKADAEATGDVVIVGRVGGRTEPILTGAAMFLLTDSSLLSCDQKGNMACPTPWDYCCEPRDLLLANTATIQVVGKDGRPLELSLTNMPGFKPLVTVTIAGKVAKRDDKGTLVINAEKIHVGTIPGKPELEQAKG